MVKNTNPLVETLTLMAEQYEKLGWEGPCILPAALLKHGVWTCDNQPDPLPVPYGTQKECFSNAADLATPESEYTYYEGYVMSEQLPMPIHHAWCVRADGVLIDSTLRRRANDTYWYHGIPVPDIWRRLDSHYGAFDATDLIEDLGFPSVRWLYPSDEDEAV